MNEDEDWPFSIENHDLLMADHRLASPPGNTHLIGVDRRHGLYPNRYPYDSVRYRSTHMPEGTGLVL